MATAYPSGIVKVKTLTDNQQTREMFYSIFAKKLNFVWMLLQKLIYLQ